MTLILTVNGPESIWMLSDRRLSFDNRPPKDDARKIMFLETTDAVAILGYAGLGATAAGSEPCDWMSAVLRGRKRTLEQSLTIIVEAMKKQFPRHMAQLPRDVGASHNILVPAFVRDEPRYYSIGLALSPDRKQYQFQYVRRVMDKPRRAGRAPRFGLSGTGGLHLSRDKTWMRNLLRIVRANDHGRIPPLAVADYLASLNYKVHREIADKSVGPRCIVAWRYKNGHKQNGGHQFYTGTAQDMMNSFLPIISYGRDIRALGEAVSPHLGKFLVAMLEGNELESKEPDWNEISAQLARLPHKPDENLR